MRIAVARNALVVQTIRKGIVTARPHRVTANSQSTTAKAEVHPNPRKSALIRILIADPYRLALLALMAIYVAVFTGMAWELHAGMRTHKADLGQIDQAIWNSSQGRWLVQTDNGFEATRLTDHVEPILVLISPIYWLWNDTRAILLLQVLLVAAGALLLYALAMRRFEQFLAPRARTQIWNLEPLHQLTRPLALALAVAYLLAPQLQSALLTEFHAAPLAVPLLLWAFWAVDAGRWRQFLVAALLTAAVKEEIALLAAGLGAWAMWRAQQEAKNPSPALPKPGRALAEGQGARGVVHNSQFTIHSSRLSPLFLSGLLILILALSWFYLATFVIVPAYAAPLYGVAESSYFQRYGALGDSPADIVRSFFTQPQVVWQIAIEPARFGYLVGLLVAFAWLSLLAPEIVLLSLPVLLANLLSAYPPQYYGEFHYSAPLAPYFAVAAAYGLGRLWCWLARRTDRTSAAFQHLPAASGGAMAAAALLQNARTAIRPLLTVGLAAYILAWSGANYLAYGRGPLAARYDPAPITAHHQLLERFVAQLPADAAVTATAAVHPHVSHRRYVYQFPMGLATPAPAEWALLDVTTNTDMAPGDLKAAVEAMLASGWGVVDAADGFLLLQQGAATKAIPDAFYSFVRLPEGNPAAGQPLQLVELAADDWLRWRQTKLAAEWQVGEGFDPAVHGPALEVVTPAGDTAVTLGAAAPPALVWYPPQVWQPGDRVRVVTLPLTLPRTFFVRAAGDDTPAVFRRTDDGRLVQLPVSLVTASDPAVALQPWFGGMNDAGAVARLPTGDPLPFRAWVAGQDYHAGEPINLWLQWGVPVWPDGLAAFVHLRQDGANVAQQDGAPLWGGAPNSVAAGGDKMLNDWRQLAIPADAGLGGRWQVVVGIYDPASGARMPLSDANGSPVGDELVVGEVRLTGPLVPDQACALNAASCQ